MDQGVVSGLKFKKIPTNTLLMYIYLQNISKSGQIGSSQHVLLLMPAVYLLENFAGMNFAHKIFKKETRQKKLIKQKFFFLKTFLFEIILRQLQFTTCFFCA